MNYLIEDYNSDHLIKVNNDDENFNMENYSMWIFDGKEYTPSLKLKIKKTLPKGIYKIDYEEGKYYIGQIKNNTDEIYKLSDKIINTILTEIDDFWNKFYAIQNKNDLVDTNYVKEYYKIQNKNGVLSKNEIKELAQLHIPMPEDKEIEKKINEENGVGRNSPEYRKFTKDVLERDEYKCQCCGSTINPEVHHIKNYRQYKNLRTDVNNGITLCEKHHSMNIIDGFHQVYGTYNNTPEQLIEYIKKRQKDLNITDFSFVRSPFVINNVSFYNDDELVCDDYDDDYAS